MNYDTMYLDEQHLSDVLTATADELDITQELYAEATLKYEQVGVWLSNDQSGIANYSPEIYPQGSFRLGTAVKPINDNCDYDIDLVCRLDIKKESISQERLKNLVGDRLKESPEYSRRLSPSRRCWNLTFPQQFHMDVLPSIPNETQEPDGILLTDTQLRHWQKSHPKAYADWFYSKMASQFNEERDYLAKARAINIEDVPEWQVKTPLQRAVQLLKRHRDVMFRDDLDNRPVSIIITTLAAYAYEGESNVYRALLNLIERMPAYITRENEKWWVRNPVEPDENFADKWNEKPEKLGAFKGWLLQVKQDVEAVKETHFRDSKRLLKFRFGDNLIERAESRLERTFGVLPAVAATVATASISADAPHALAPSWPIEKQFKARIIGSVYLRKNGKRLSELSQRPLAKGTWLRFSVETNTPGEYRVFWQVVNTGQEAQAAYQLRGDFYQSETVSSRIRWESVGFKGTHWIEAFIIKNGICVARTGRRYVLVG